VLVALGAPDRVAGDMVFDCLLVQMVSVCYPRHVQIEVRGTASHGPQVIRQSGTVCDRWRSTTGRTSDSCEVKDQVPALDIGTVSHERLEPKLQSPASTIIRAANSVLSC